jgi:hypothetical protein
MFKSYYVVPVLITVVVFGLILTNQDSFEEQRKVDAANASAMVEASRGSMLEEIVKTAAAKQASAASASKGR